MTREERIQFAIDRFQRELRLGQWDIRYNPDWEETDEATAHINYRPNELTGTITLHPDVSGDNIDAHVAHELSHLTMLEYRRLTFGVIASIGPQMTPVLDILADLEERICDTIAHALTGVKYIPVGEPHTKWHAPFVDTTTCMGYHAQHAAQGEPK